MKNIFYILFIFPIALFGQHTKEVLFSSKELKTDRKIRINTPENYEVRKDSLHLIFLLDGNNNSLFDYTVASKRFLEENSMDLSDYKAPQSVIVGIEQSEDRWDDFGDSINSSKFLAFLERELLPYIQANYRTVNYKILIGHSLGGRFAINTLLDRPALFNAVIAASPAFSKKSTDRILKKFDTFFQSGLPFDRALYFSTTYIKGDGTEEDFREFSETLEKYLKKKEQNNFRFEFKSSNTLGHAKSPYFSVPEGLHFIYSPALWQLQVGSLFSKGTSANQAAKDYQERIKRRFGIPVSIHSYIPILADELIKNNKTPEAIDLQKKEVDLQPADLYLFGQFLLLLKKNNISLYKTYRQKFITTMKLMKLADPETKERLKEID